MGWHERALEVARKHKSVSDIGHLLFMVGWQLTLQTTDPAKHKRFVAEGLAELRDDQPPA